MIHKLRHSVKTIPNISSKNVLLLQTRTEGFPRRTNYRECSQGLPPTWQQLVRGSGVIRRSPSCARRAPCRGPLHILDRTLKSSAPKDKKKKKKKKENFFSAREDVA